jgi:predicted transcriptional regulator of viral defense system
MPLLFSTKQLTNLASISKNLYFCKKTGMNFQEFRMVFEPQRVFSTKDIAKQWPDFNFVNLVNWQRKGYLLKLRNTWYAFPGTLRSEQELYLIANRLHRPSYVSLATALRYYNWIPESVFSVTSVTTAKPGAWRTPVGHFEYRSIQPRLFFGYQLIQNAEAAFLIAEPEKTLLDWLYFHPHLVAAPDFAALRLKREEIAAKIDLSLTADYLSLFASPALEQRWEALQKYLEL